MPLIANSPEPTALLAAARRFRRASPQLANVTSALAARSPPVRMTRTGGPAAQPDKTSAADATSAPAQMPRAKAGRPGRGSRFGKYAADSMALGRHARDPGSAESAAICAVPPLSCQSGTSAGNR
jgi:hypothetical protein